MKLFVILAGSMASCVAAWAATPPNFIVVLGEGGGWAGSSVQMDDREPRSKSEETQTPNLERLAAAGMRFSTAYAASPRCTPSRAALFTGKSPAQLHMTFVNEGKRDGGRENGQKVLTPTPCTELPEEETTLAEVLKQAGYATAHFGKWHVGRASPNLHGFDENDGPNNNGGPENIPMPNPKQALEIIAKGVCFMERQVKKGQPFYLQLSHYPNQSEKGGHAHETPGTETKIVDQTLGQLLDAVERLGLRNNTYVLYTTDHGAPGRNPPLTGGKGTVWEGGLRVPFLVAGPGVSSGSNSHTRVSALDVFPTFLELAGLGDSLPDGIEGGSFAGVLRNGGVGEVLRPREEFVVHFPHYDKDQQGPASAIYSKNWKLIHLYESGRTMLFDLSKDPGEWHDLAQEMPDVAGRMDADLMAYLQTMKAGLPAPNPNNNPVKGDGKLSGREEKGGER